MLKAEIVGASPLTTYTNCPDGSTLTAVEEVTEAAPLAGTVPIAPSVPIVGLMLNAVTVPSPVLATYRNRPLGSTATLSGFVPTGSGAASSVRMPLEL